MVETRKYSRLVPSGTVLPAATPTYTDLFKNLPDQRVNRRMQRDYDLAVLVCGTSGTGKSTLIDNLFNIQLSRPASAGYHSRVFVEEDLHAVYERVTTIHLNLAEVKGLGDQVDSTNAPTAVVDYIESKYEEYLSCELKACRIGDGWPDRRVHMCLYLISPTPDGLGALDLLMLKRLSQIVNVIPLIAKADTMLPDEIAQYKQLISAQFKQHCIKVYGFEVNGGAYLINTHIPEDAKKIAEDVQDRDILQSKLPLCVSASNDAVGKRMHRVYAWGTTNVESEEETDFSLLRKALLRWYTHELVEATHAGHYEDFRRERMLQMGFIAKTADGRVASLKDMYNARNTQHTATKNYRLAELNSKFEKKREEITEALDQKFTKMQNEWQAKIDAIKEERQAVREQTEQLKIELSKRRGARPSAKHTDGDAGVADRHSKMTVSSARPNGEV